ncbi:heavy metal translocating P-type ATPase [Daejeonella oryzae]|uniref:heavy metal translocating P-type ATPase n=1 Tax=Daejeonella oryzae TaxID=1122943 RepID=UPI00040B331C|nr:heavy metal translocating P-type ATPase [Daejeonella oryzae]
MEKTQINLNILLPEVPDERDACVARLINQMEGQKGVEEVHLKPRQNGTPAQLCFHYNADLISLEKVKFYAEKAGASISKQYGHLIADTRGLKDMNQANVIEDNLKKIPGILDVSVGGTGTIRIEFDQNITDKHQVISAIEKYDLKVNAYFQVIDQGHVHDHNAETSEYLKIHSSESVHAHSHDDGHDHDHTEGADQTWRIYVPVAISSVLLIFGLIADNYLKPPFFSGFLRLIYYIIAYIPVGWPVASRGIKYAVKGNLFTEFFLMTLATTGAFFIGEYPEGVAVMLFYTVGELFQDSAVNKAKRSIKALLDIRPESASVFRDGKYHQIKPEEVQIGEIIQIKPGEKVALDGEMLSESSSFNTAALTGESKPSTLRKGENILAGMINQEKLLELRVNKLYNDSSLARILNLVQEATTRKAKTEQFIRKFSRMYTPVIVFLAICIVFLPYLFDKDYVFNEWLYRALVFLVVSCPCALVISIPLGYFGGIGAASHAGILFKGSNFLDLMTKVNMVVMDKTGTLTKGVFKVQEVKSLHGDENEWLPLAAALESKSTHPVAQAVADYAAEKSHQASVENAEEINGHGIRGMVNGKPLLAGNVKLMEKFNVAVPQELKNLVDTIVLVAINGELAGYIIIADELKEDSKEAIAALHKRHIKTVMLSGDKQAVVDKIASELGIDNAYGDLLPENKVQRLEELKKDLENVIAFVGDGINDAPVLALSDVGIAMGGLGSDAAIQTADVIIQTDHPSKIAKAIDMGKATNRVVWQNISFAFVVKGIVLILGAGGLATMWEAVFADVGVALLAILNAVRIQKMKF